MSDDPFPVGSGWDFLKESASVVVLRVTRAGEILAANRHAVTLIGEPLVGKPWHTLWENYDGKTSFADWLAETVQPRLLNNRTTFGLSQTLEMTVEPTGEDFWLFGEVNAAEQARLGREVLELNYELNNVSRELALANAELNHQRFRLEELVAARTLALQKANDDAALEHRANEERIRLDAEARMHSRKLEAVGTLAAGIAHDFNNILGSIIGFAEMTGDELPDDSVAKRNVAQILRAGFRARDLIARILAFARQGSNEPEAVNVVAETKLALDLLRASLRPSVQLSFQSSLDAANALVLAEPTQIQQIVMNLCINAADAMDNHGNIRISIDHAGKIEGAPPGHLGGICLTVADNGSGMTPEVLERVFDPFFTTKAPGKGSGLGLSVVYGIVTGLGGLIEVQSHAGGSITGSEFRVFLPPEKSEKQKGETNGTHPAD